MSKLLLIVILVILSVSLLRLAKNLGVSKKFRIYLIGIVVIISIAIYLSFCISSLTDNKNNDTNNKEEVIIQI